MKKIISSVLLFAILAVAALALVSCAPNSDPEKAAKALEDAGYTVMNGVKDGKGTLVASKGEDAVTITWFENDEQAKEAEEAYQKLYDAAKDAGEDVSDADFGSKGNMFWAGTKAAVKAAR